jgi:hypothetical protein
MILVRNHPQLFVRTVISEGNREDCFKVWRCSPSYATSELPDRLFAISHRSSRFRLGGGACHKKLQCRQNVHSPHHSLSPVILKFARIELSRPLRGTRRFLGLRPMRSLDG